MSVSPNMLIKYDIPSTNKRAHKIRQSPYTYKVGTLITDLLINNNPGKQVKKTAEFRLLNLQHLDIEAVH
jgi:hypothetical protein